MVSLPAVSRKVCSLEDCSTGDGRDLGGRVDADGQGRPVESAEVAGRDRVVGIDHGEAFGRQVVEQLRFRQAVVLDRRMIVEVVAADVGHAGGVESHAGHAVLRQGVAGDLHRRVRAAGGHHASEPGRQLVGGRRGPRRRFRDFAVEVAQRAQQAGAMSGGGEHAGHQATRGRLAVGAGDADHLQPVAGIAGQGLADAAVGVAGVGHEAERHVQPRQRSLGEHGASAARQGLGDEVVAVAAAARQGGEQIARPDAPRIAGAAADADVVGAEQLGFRQQAAQTQQVSNRGTNLHVPRPPCL